MSRDAWGVSLQGVGGRPIMGMAVHHERLRQAVAQLLTLDPSDLRSLKVTAGEHLAALLLTSFVQAPPVAIDKHGTVDLIFEVPQGLSESTILPPGSRIAFEVKSAPGAFRRYAARLKDEPGPNDRGFSLTIQAAADVLAGMSALVEAAGKRLRATTAVDRRYVFLVIHPLDKLAAELAESPLGAQHLPVPSMPDGVDGLWVLWVPDQLTVWSCASDCWWQLLFEVFDPKQGMRRDQPELAFLQEIEDELLAGMGYNGPTPYLFGVSAGEVLPPLHEGDEPTEPGAT